METLLIRKEGGKYHIKLKDFGIFIDDEYDNLKELFIYIDLILQNGGYFQDGALIRVEKEMGFAPEELN